MIPEKQSSHRCSCCSTAAREELGKAHLKSIDPEHSLKHPPVMLIYINRSKAALRLQSCVGSDSHFLPPPPPLPLGIDLTLHPGNADIFVPRPRNKSWNPQDWAGLFLSVRQHCRLLYILSLSHRRMQPPPPPTHPLCFLLHE